MRIKKNWIFLLLIVFGAPAPAQTKALRITAPEWSKNASIYEVNFRQYTQEGTIAAFQSHLPRLKEMGIGILWLMPIHPIGEKNRKGTLGSYYSVRDYYGLDPNLGTKDDFRKFVDAVHEAGMTVIIDWVANHTSWDNELMETHPDFYTRDSLGNAVAPVPDWKDVADLDYGNRLLWDYMASAMEYWVREFDIDGYRCDVAGMVPTEFWLYLRPRLEKIKPVFMLAEWEEAKLHENAFDMTYSWNLMHLMNKVAKNEEPPYKLLSLVEKELKEYPSDAYRMRFTTNHDENSWNGTSNERLGTATEAFNVFMATIPGMPLVYSGQEAGETKRLSFFDKDVIDWQDHPNAQLFSVLLNEKKRNPALWNGSHGGEYSILTTDTASSIVSFLRKNGNHTVIVCVNFGDTENIAILADKRIKGNLKNLFSGQTRSNKGLMEVRIKPYQYEVWYKE